MENQLMMKVFSITVILSVSHLSVRGHKQYAVNIPAVRRAGLIPLTLDTNLYWYEIMHCYAVKGYPCMIDPMAFTGHVTCLTKDNVCDGLQQCPNGDDEMGQCGPLAQFCRSDQLRCANGICASPCDGRAECPYGVDERSCKALCETPLRYRCDKDELMCSDMKCAKICNGKRECPAGEDERRCLPECKRGEMICPKTGKCAELCDEIAECNEEEDESSCGSKTVQCDLNNITRCILKNCAKVPECDIFDASIITGLMAVCVSGEERKGIPDNELFTNLRGCDSKKQVIDCICNGGLDCITFVSDVLGQCEF